MEKQERHLLVEELFQKALELRVEERAAFLSSSCGHDPDLLKEVKSLVAADQLAESYLSVSPHRPYATTELSLPAISGQSFGHYQILNLLGKGGMGEVYRARDTRLARDVAIKFVPPDLARDETRLRRLEREARMLASLNHPNIATIFGLEYFGEHRLLVMEMVGGETLEERIERGPLPLDQALPIFRQISESLEAAHERGVIHRDLKPSNIKVLPDGKVKLLDFGLAKALDLEPKIESHGVQSSITESGLILGTPAYMSPEQASGETADKRTDIWAFGCVFYEALTGQKSFTGKSLPDLLSRVLRDEPDWTILPGDTPESIRNLLMRCTRKDPGERLQDMSEARMVIDEAVADPQRVSSATAGLRGWTSRAGRPGWRRLAWAGGALIILIAGILAFNALKPGLGSEAKPADPITLAVLPFQILTEKEQIGYLGIGITDAIITRLANIAQLRVRPTSSILRYKDDPPDVQDAGRTLRAENVLSGTLQQAAATLRVNVQLTRVSDGAPLWGQQYDITQQNLLTLQDQLAEKITTALRIRVTEAERERVYKQYTGNAAAYDQYLRGQALLSLGTSSRAAVDSFEQALKIDPNYALAHAGLAQASARMYNSVATDAERQSWGERAETEARAALALDPELGEAHAALADYYGLTEFNWDRTIEEARRALELNPALERPHFALAGAYLHTGLLNLVEPETMAVVELNPVASQRPVYVGITMLLSHRYAEAVQLLEQSRERAGPSAFLDWHLATALFYAGHRERAEELLASAKRGDEPDIRSQAALASFIAARGDRAGAEELMKKVVNRPSFEHHAMYHIAQAHAQLGEPAEAVSLLRRARDTGYFCYPFYAGDPLLKPLAGNPEFKAFMEEFRKSWEEFRARYGKGSG